MILLGFQRVVVCITLEHTDVKQVIVCITLEHTDVKSKYMYTIRFCLSQELSDWIAMSYCIIMRGWGTSIPLT